jgi:hypothetical protein
MSLILFKLIKIIKYQNMTNKELLIIPLIHFINAYNFKNKLILK